MAYRLFYPASFLPHKNHHLLLDSELLHYFVQNNIQVAMTIDSKDFPIELSSVLICLGRLNHDECISFLRQSDALLFLSQFESLGLPLIEAASARKPVICFDLPYCRELLGDSPYYIQQGFKSTNPICSILAKFLCDQPNPRQSLLIRDMMPTSMVWSHFINAI